MTQESTNRDDHEHDQTTPNKGIAQAAKEKEQQDAEKQQKKGEKKPAGGYDGTEIPHAPPGYTVKFTFHKATKLPIADLTSMSSDPYCYAQLNTSLGSRHREDPILRFRTPTVWGSTDPEWNEVWIVAHVPASGFKLKVRVYDEDQGNQDDRLGNVHVNVSSINESWKGFQHQAFKIKKRSGSWRAYAMRAIAVCFHEATEMSGHLYISAEVLGKSEGSEGGRCYTTGLNHWCRHYSPLLGRIANRRDSQENDEPGQDQREISNTTQTARNGSGSASSKKKKKKTERYNFQANQMQLRGPVPPELYHRYVEFKPFIQKLFTSKGIAGAIMHSALHHQHVQVYNFNKDTKYGAFDEPCDEMTRQFLDLVHYDAGGRIFTYVLTLDAMMRFTETGKEFGIDMLSKHTMHSDASVYIAFSGEFFIRRYRGGQDRRQSQTQSPGEQWRPYAQRGDSHDQEFSEKHDQSSSHADQNRPDFQTRTDHSAKDHKNPPHDPHLYEMIIDNDSGTYRPNAKLLPLLRSFLESNFVGLHVTTLDCQADAEKMKKMKQEQIQRKKDTGQMQVFRQASRNGSVSSSDESALDAAEASQGGEGTASSAHGHDNAISEAAHALGQGARPHVSNLFKQGGTGE